MTKAHRDLLGKRTERLVAFDRAEANHDGNTLVGFAAVFNVWAEIDSWEGQFRERIDPHAFDKTIAERGVDFTVLFNHGHDPTLGQLPLGVAKVVEPRSKGLWTETSLSSARSVQEEIKPRLQEGSLGGMSITFEVLDDEWGEGADGVEERTVKEIKMHEFGPVTFPAFTTTTAGVRSKDSGEAKAVLSEDEDRSTDEAAASEDEDRDTSALETIKARALVRSLDVERQRKEYEAHGIDT